MDINHSNHPTTLFILVLIVIAVSVLGVSTLKNVKNSVSSIVYITPSPFPQPTKKPVPSVIPESTVSAKGFFPEEMTLEEAQQQKPPPPAGLTVLQTPEGFQLQWKATRGDVISYAIYRSDEKSAFKKISTRTVDENREKTGGTYEFTDSSVIFGTTYTYVITVTNIFKNESDRSEPVVVKYEVLTVE